MAFVPVFTKLIISGWHYVDSFHTVFRQNPLINIDIMERNLFIPLRDVCLMKLNML